MKTDKPKTPTEPFTLSDAWNGFRSTYLPFVEWQILPEPDEETSIAILEFVDNEPSSYTNKWSREQFKMEVIQNDEHKILSAGKRLFAVIGAFCNKNLLYPVELGKVQLFRWGSGFDIQYSIELLQSKK